MDFFRKFRQMFQSIVRQCQCQCGEMSQLSDATRQHFQMRANCSTRGNSTAEETRQFHRSTDSLEDISPISPRRKPIRIDDFSTPVQLRDKPFRLLVLRYNWTVFAFTRHSSHKSYAITDIDESSVMRSSKEITKTFEFEERQYKRMTSIERVDEEDLSNECQRWALTNGKCDSLFQIFLISRR